MNDRDRLEGLMFLSRLHFDRFQARRNWEWKLTFTLWAVLAAAANALREVEELPWCFYVLGGVTVVALHFIWEKFIERETYRNRIFGERLGKEIDDLVGFDPGSDDDGYRLDKIREHKRWAAHYWQVAITLLLVLVAGAVLYW